MDRYPGLRAFERNDTELYFGRDNDIAVLFDTILYEKTTVLFGNSGTGKSSLLNTRITEILEKNGLFPVRIRFSSYFSAEEEQGVNDPSKKRAYLPPQEVFEHTITEVLKSNNFTKEDIPILFDNKNPQVWECIKQLETALNKQRKEDHNGIILIFDQFEEFFNYSASEQENFIKQIAELINDWPPKRVLDWINNIPLHERTEAIKDWNRQPDVKVLFSIRSDRLSLISNLVNFIPKILRNRYELTPFRSKNAREAICNPAALPNRNERFQSAPIEFSEGVIEKLITELSNDTGEIECTFLQIVCFYIEETIKKVAPDKTTPFRFDEAMLNENINIANIMDRFYYEQTERFGPNKELVRELIENHLVVDGQRATLLRSQMLAKLYKQAELITQLQQSRLIIELKISAERVSYELSHDRLIKPVEKSRERREDITRIEKEAEAEKFRIAEEARKKEEALKQEALLRETRLKEQRAQLNLQKKLKTEALAAKEVAEREKLKAEELKIIAVKERFLANEARLKARQRSWLLVIVGTTLIIFAGYFLLLANSESRMSRTYLSNILVNQARDKINQYRIPEAVALLQVAEEQEQSALANSVFAETAQKVLTGKALLSFGNGKILANSTKDSALFLWDASRTPFKLLQYLEHVEEFQINETGTLALILTTQHSLVILDLKKNSIADTLSYFYSKTAPREQFSNSTNSSSYLASRCIPSPDGTAFAILDSSDRLRVYTITGTGILPYSNKVFQQLDSINTSFKELNFSFKELNTSYKRLLLLDRNIYNLIFFSNDGHNFIYNNPAIDYRESNKKPIEEKAFVVSFKVKNILHLFSLKTPTDLGKAYPYKSTAFNNDLRLPNSDSMVYIDYNNNIQLLDIKTNTLGTDSFFASLYKITSKSYGRRFVNSWIIFSDMVSENDFFCDYPLVTHLVNYRTRNKFIINTFYSNYVNIYPRGNNLYYIDSSKKIREQNIFNNSPARIVDNFYDKKLDFSPDGSIFSFIKNDSVFIKRTASGELLACKKVPLYTTSLFAGNSYILINNNQPPDYYTQLQPVYPFNKRFLYTLFPDLYTDTIRKKYKLKKS